MTTAPGRVERVLEDGRARERASEGRGAREGRSAARKLNVELARRAARALRVHGVLRSRRVTEQRAGRRHADVPWVD